MWRIIVLALLLLVGSHGAHAQGACLAAQGCPAPLPGGYLTVSADQYLSGGTVNVRPACAWFTGAPNDMSMPAIFSAGFNCIVLGWRDQMLTQSSTLPLFDDEFTTLSLHNTWQSGDNWQLIVPGNTTGRGGVPVFGETGDQWWTNPFNTSTPIPGGTAPAPLYSVDTNGLNLQLLSLPAGDQAYVNSQCGCSNLSFAGTLLNSSQTFLRVFGYTEMQVAVDKINGFTFQADEEAFPVTPVWPPEIDFPKIWTDSTGVQWLEGIINRSSGPSPEYVTSSNSGFDASIMHTYGVDWESNNITLYVDGAQVFQTPNPQADNYNNNTPAFWYLLTAANYPADHGAAVGDPNPASLPAHAHVKYFRAYAQKPSATTSTGTCGTLSNLQTCVANAASAGLGVILSHIGNEVPTAANSPCWGRQQNGLWFDNGPNSGSDDGCLDGSNVPYSTFKANTVNLLQTFAGNSSVIGYEMHHEPVVDGSYTGQGATGGGGTGGTGAFHVSGGKILNPSGNVQEFTGVVMWGDQGCPSCYPSGPPLSQLTPALTAFNNKANFVRIMWFLSDFSGSGGSWADSGFDPIVNSNTSAGIVTMLQDGDYPGTLSGGSLNTSEVHYNTQAKRYAQNTFVWWATQNEPNSFPDEEIKVIYSAVRNVWFPGTTYFAGDQREHAGNLYRQNNGQCSSAGSGGPTGTGSGIGDGSCSWSFVSASQNAGSPSPILLTATGGFCPSVGNGVNGMSVSTPSNMTNVVIDCHFYGGSEAPGINDQPTMNSTFMSNINAANNAGARSLDGVIPAMTTETGNGCCADSNNIGQIDGNSTQVAAAVTRFSGVGVPWATSTAYSAGNSRSANGNVYFENNSSCVSSGSGTGPSGTGSNISDGSCSWNFVSTQATAALYSGYAAFGINLIFGQGQSTGFDVLNGFNAPQTQLTTSGQQYSVGMIGPISAGGGGGGGGTGNAAINWGGGGTTDILAACEDVGAAVFAVNPGPILFCPGPINNSATLFNGTSRGTTNPHQDLTLAASRPVTANGLPANKIAYSVDEFPNSVSGYTSSDNGATAISAYNTSWGYLLKNHTAPVMAMSVGCACDGTVGNSADDNAWATTFTQYVNGQSAGGPVWPTFNEPASAGWYAWGYLGSANPDGTLLSDKLTLNASQRPYWLTLLYTPTTGSAPAPTTTWNTNDSTAGVTVTNNGLTATTDGVTNPAAIRSTTSKSTGTVCWEVTASTISQLWGTGVASGSWSLGAPGTPNAIQFTPAFGSGLNQATWLNNALLSSGANASVNGETMAECADFGAKLLWDTSPTMRSTSGAGAWNNSGTCNPTVAACGLSFSGLTCPCFVEADDNAQVGVFVLNTGALQSVSMPSGFSQWDTTVASTGQPMIMIFGHNDNHRPPANDNIWRAAFRSIQ